MHLAPHRSKTALAVVAVLVVTTVTLGSHLVSGQSAVQENVFVPIVPCRLLDTRSGPSNLGPRDTPIGGNEAAIFGAHSNNDADSTCEIPATATAIATNVVAVNPTSVSFLTLYPGDADHPGTANLNFVAGQAPTPNAVNISLSPDGEFNVYNAAGTTDVIADINGYYQPATNIGTPGPQGPIGPEGPAGPQGPAGASITGHTIIAVDSAESVGQYTSLRIGRAGNPIISYYDSTNRDLKVVACNTPTCLNTSITTVDSNDDVGMFTSIAIANNGKPTISYYDDTNGDLKVAACRTFACTDATITTVDSGGDVGQGTSIAIGADNNPVISYYDDTNGDLKVAACTNTTCTSTTITTVDSDAGGFDSSIAIGTDGNPIISYHDDINRDLKVAACTNATCTNATTTIVDPDGSGSDSSIAIGADGNPIISYQYINFGDLRVAACANLACTNATITTLDAGGLTGRLSSIAIGADANPVISYYNYSGSNLRVAACTDSACTNATVTTLDSDGGALNLDVGKFSSIAIGADAKPVISYSDSTNRDLKVAVCGNPTCANYPT